MGGKSEGSPRWNGGGYDGDSHRYGRSAGSIFDSGWFGGGYDDDDGGPWEMDAFDILGGGYSSHTTRHSASAVSLDGGAGQESADVFEKTEGGAGIYHAGNKVVRTIALSTRPPSPPRPPSLGGESDDSTGWLYWGKDGKAYSTLHGAKFHGGGYGYKNGSGTVEEDMVRFDERGTCSGDPMSILNGC